MFMSNQPVPVDVAMRDIAGHIPEDEHRVMVYLHNLNLESIDADWEDEDDELDGLSVVDEIELFGCDEEPFPQF